MFGVFEGRRERQYQYKDHFIPLGAPTTACLRRSVQTAACSVCGWCAVHHVRHGQLFAVRLDICFMNKSDAADAFHFFHADIRSHGVPSAVEYVSSEDGGEFSGVSFKQLYAERRLRQDSTTPDTPKFNGVVGQGLGIVQQAAHAAWLEASRQFSDVKLLPPTYRLWAAAGFWACEMHQIGNDGKPRQLLPA